MYGEDATVKHAIRSCDQVKRNRTRVIRNLPIGECVLDVVTCSVDEHTVLIPGSTLYTHILMYCAQTLQLPRANSNC